MIKKLQKKGNFYDKKSYWEKGAFVVVKKWTKWKQRIQFHMTPTRFIVLGYFAAVILSTFFLTLPISLQPGVELSFIDALFTATSAVSVTGLTVVNTAETFTIFGSFVLIIVFQLGGIGIMTLGTFLYLLFGRHITLSYRRLIATDQNRHRSLSGLVSLMRFILLISFVIESICAVFLGIYFYAAGYYDHFPTAMFYGLFHSVSSFTNAGFDLFGNSLHPFAGDYVVQLLTMFLLILGAIGFPVLMEVREYFSRRNPYFRFSLFTKLTTAMFFSLLILGTIGIFILENNLYYADKSWHEKLFFSLFNSVTTRSGGLSTMDVSEFSTATQFIMSILMFIGASPSSVGGGIRTTTFAVLILTLIAYALGKNETRVFRRSLKQEDVMKSFTVFSMGIMLVGTAVVVIESIEWNRFPLVSIIFEICSAFGTSGLSLGITPELSTGSKLVLIALMFIGRIGILTWLFSFRTSEKKQYYHYPKEDVIIG